MKVLIACEESQEVCKAFRERGHEAFSCDILECSGDHPEWHIQGDVIPLLNEDWDLIIAHPPCTYLTVTGNRWFNVERYGDKAQQRLVNREKAIDFFMNFVNANCDKIVIENPIGCMSTRYRKPDQIIQPWMFGDNYSKSTCLWEKGVKPLEPIVKVQPELEWFDFIDRNGKKKRMPKWYSDAWKLPAEERAKVRSKTFHGIAQAMADQWG